MVSTGGIHSCSGIIEFRGNEMLFTIIILFFKGLLPLALRLACSQNCFVCYSASTCTECASGYLSKGQCVNACPNGVFSMNGVCMGML